MKVIIKTMGVKLEYKDIKWTKLKDGCLIIRYNYETTPKNLGRIGTKITEFKIKNK